MRTFRPALVIVAALALAACGGVDLSDDRSEPVGHADGTVISVDDSGFGGNFFEPAHTVVPAGTTVTWQWQGDREHDVVGEGFESPVQGSGAFSHTFDEPGTYEYTCTLHDGMDGVIEVGD